MLMRLLTIGLNLNKIESNHKLFVVGSHEIWCNFYELSKTTCELFDLIKPSFIKESCCHV
jgi:hypothetical protein